MPKEAGHINIFNKGMRTDVNPRDINQSDQKRREEIPLYFSSVQNLGSGRDEGSGKLLTTFGWEAKELSSIIGLNPSPLEWQFANNANVFSCFMEHNINTESNVDQSPERVELLFLPFFSVSNYDTLIRVVERKSRSARTNDSAWSYACGTPDSSIQLSDYVDISAFENYRLPVEYQETSDGVRISFGNDIAPIAFYVYNKTHLVSVSSSGATAQETGVNYSDSLTYDFYLGKCQLDAPPRDWLHRDTETLDFDVDLLPSEEDDYIRRYMHWNNPRCDDATTEVDGTVIQLDGWRDYKIMMAFSDYNDEEYENSEEDGPPDTLGTTVAPRINVGCSYYDIWGQETEIVTGKVLKSAGPGSSSGDKWIDVDFALFDATEDVNSAKAARQILVRGHSNIYGDGVSDEVSTGHLEKRTQGLRLYFRDKTDGKWTLLYDVNFHNGEITYGIDGSVRPINGRSGGYWGNGIGETNNHNDFLDRISGLTYEIINQTANSRVVYPKYACSAVLNNRMYIGDVRYSRKSLATGTWTKGEAYNDRMLLSGFGKYDSYSFTNLLEVNKEDGYKITRLLAYQGNILEFKENGLTVIQMGGKAPKVKSTHDRVGISKPNHLVVTSLGPIWMNINGVYLYTPKRIINLIHKKIHISEWKSFYSSSKTLGDNLVEEPYPSILYDPLSMNILVYRELTSWGGGNIMPIDPYHVSEDVKGYNYNLDDYSWTQIYGSESIRFSQKGGSRTSRPFSRWDSLDSKQSLTTITQPSNATDRLIINRLQTGRPTVSYCNLITAEYDLGSLGVDKRLSKLHIHYSSNDVAPLVVRASINGDDFITIDEDDWLSTYHSTDYFYYEPTRFSVKTIDLKQLSSAHTVKFQIETKPLPPGGDIRDASTLTGDFRIIEMAIIYRRKNVK
tara:strand:- start:49307 stop:52012 length:2706 start_codon:yes stop_codon:yes gene_type:complete